MLQKVCGIDVHRDLLVATILNPKTQNKQTMHFQNSLDDIDQLITWLKQQNCQKTVMEKQSWNQPASTGNPYTPPWKQQTKT